jgi:hypothetical protein
MSAMTAGERDKKMDEIATWAATAFCRKYENATKESKLSPLPTPARSLSIRSRTSQSARFNAKRKLSTVSKLRFNAKKKPSTV